MSDLELPFEERDIVFSASQKIEAGCDQAVLMLIPVSISGTGLHFTLLFVAILSLHVRH